MTDLEVLKAMRELISMPERHTCGEYARDYNGNPVETHSKDAVSFCLTGAELKVRAGVGPITPSEWVIYRYIDYPITFNDNNSHETVMEKLDGIIFRLEEEGSDLV